MNFIPLFEEDGTLMPEDIYQPLNNSLKTLETLHLKQNTHSQDNVRFKQSINKISLKLLKTIQTSLRFPWIHSYLLCCFDLMKQVNKSKILFIKLLRGLLDHPRAYQFSLGSSLQDIKIIETEYKNAVESNIIFIIAFTKAISSNLSFHPNLHVIDLYFS